MDGLVSGTDPSHDGRSRLQVPVLVVGAGPTGLLLAAELRRRGVACHLIDGHPGPLHWDRATVVHPRSLELFESMGLVDQFLAAGCRQRQIKIYSSGEMLGTLDLAGCDSHYGFNLGLSQEVTESILTEYLGKNGGEVNWGGRLVDLEARADGVLARIETERDTYELEGRWVVGCDGLHSLVRELSGIGFEGHDIEKPWAVFDASIQNWRETFEANFVYLEHLPLILTALPDQRWRAYFRPSSPECDLVAEAEAILSRYNPGTSFANVENPTRFHCHTKVATRFRSGPVFLAGDAAHVCSPAEGHGMNCGLQDAFNLAWKLALVHHEIADSGILESYEAERRPAAELVTRSGDAAEEAQMTPNRGRRDAAIKAMFADPMARHQEIVAETELNVQYSSSPIVLANDAGELSPGKRLPTSIRVEWPDRRSSELNQVAHRVGHTLLLLAGETGSRAALEDLKDALEDYVANSDLFEVAVSAGCPTDLPATFGRLAPEAGHRLGLGNATLIAVRPDGHIGLRADSDYFGMLDRYREVFRTVAK